MKMSANVFVDGKWYQVDFEVVGEGLSEEEQKKVLSALAHVICPQV